MNLPLPKDQAPGPHRRRARVSLPHVTLAHGSGGKAMRDLIDDVFLGAFDNPALAPLEDQARFDLAALQAQGDRLAFTTDSYVVDPLVFQVATSAGWRSAARSTTLRSAAPGRSTSAAV